MWDPDGSEVGQVGPTCPDESHLGPMWASCQGLHLLHDHHTLPSS